MEIVENKSLKEFTTFRIGGLARFFCSVKNEKELLEALNFAKEKSVPFFILGGGSNILISDDGFSGLVIKMDIKGIDFTELVNDDGELDEKKEINKHVNVRVTAKAGEDWDTLVAITVEKGLHGLENLSFIPGTVGAAPVQNIGAYGSEVKDTIDSVRVFDTEEHRFIDLSNFDCHFQYRNSIFKKSKNRYIITSVVFILKKNGKVNIEYKDIKEYFASKNIKDPSSCPSISEVRQAIIDIRRKKLPDIKVVGTAGSFFKNPHITHAKAHELKEKYFEIPIYQVDDKYMKVSLAWIIDHICKYKGVTEGNVGTYKNQALVIVNNGNATSKEIISFADAIKKDVKEKIGVDIEEEVEYV
ncbi:MAG TPA: UDP-N-acetylmuramate dehydrogenase [Candidatus Paceibacterota bacterium]